MTDVVPDRIEVEGSTVTITWSDGVIAELSATDLRSVCECASCREPSGIEATRAVLGGGQPIAVTEARLVGGYAITFTFAPDGHSTGIYPFERLRSLSENGD